MKRGPKFLTDLALVGLATAALAACASHPPPPPAAPGPPPMSQEGPPPPPGEAPPPSETGAPIPGSARDFIINVGDRVYFDFNAADIRADADPILDGQAAWLRRYPDVQVRRARHARVQFRPRREARRRGARLSGRSRRRARPHHHDLLRQGAADRSRPRRSGLGEGPQRPHGDHRGLALRPPDAAISPRKARGSGR